MDEWMNGFPFTFHLSLFTLPELVAQARECFAFVQCVNPIKVWVASCEDLSFHLSPFTFNLQPSTLSLQQKRFCFLKVFRCIDADGLHIRQSHFDAVTVLQPAQLLQALRQFER